MNPPMPQQKPDRLIAVGVMILISGILNILWGMGLFFAITILGLGTLLIGCLCLPMGAFPLVLGILEILYAAKLLRRQMHPNVKPAYYIAVMEIIDMLFGNVIALVVGVATLILYNDVAVRRYFGET